MSRDIVARAVQESMLMLEQGVARDQILNRLVETAETVAGGDVVSSILVLDKEGLLRNGASPGLPKDYLKAIDGLRPDARVGTCAAAAATGKMIVTCDFRADDKWAELRHLPMALGFVGAWSMPIKNVAGKVLGTFGTYFRKLREPNEDEITSVASLASVAARVLER